MKTILLTLCFGLSAASLAWADDWPQWRGPQRNGISKDTGLLPEWPKEGPKLLWKSKEVGAGYSTPSVVGSRLYTLSNEGLENESVTALNVADGKKAWSTRIGKVGNPNQQPAYPGSRSTPTVEGDRVYVLGSDGDLVCLNAADGKVRWQKNVRTEFGGLPGRWAYAESPLIDGDKLVVCPGGSNATMVALNKSNGELIWKSVVPGGDEAAYASAVVFEDQGVRQYVQFLQKGVVGIDAKTGKFLWRYDKTAQNSPANIPTPVVHNGFIFTGSGRGGASIVRLKGKDPVTVEEVAFQPKLPTSIGGAVVVGDHLYGTTAQGLVCAVMSSGEVKWQERSIGAAALCVADGHLYLNGENGDLALVEAIPTAYKEKSRFTPMEQPNRARSKLWSYPVIANGRLYIQDLGEIRCYDLKK